MGSKESNQTNKKFCGAISQFLYTFCHSSRTKTKQLQNKSKDSFVPNVYLKIDYRLEIFVFLKYSTTLKKHYSSEGVWRK